MELKELQQQLACISTHPQSDPERHPTKAVTAELPRPRTQSCNLNPKPYQKKTKGQPFTHLASHHLVGSQVALVLHVAHQHQPRRLPSFHVQKLHVRNAELVPTHADHVLGVHVAIRRQKHQLWATEKRAVRPGACRGSPSDNTRAAHVKKARRTGGFVVEAVR